MSDLLPPSVALDLEDRRSGDTSTPRAVEMRICKNCGAEFAVSAKYIKRGRVGVFCNAKCRLTQHPYRFWSRTVKNANGCLLWTGETNHGGYGLVSIAYKARATHRYAWELANGPIAGGLHVLHRCDVRACVNPEHLFLGTHADNMRDMETKGRRADIRGERHPLFRLTDEQVRSLRSEFVRADGYASNARELSSRYGVTPTTVIQIALGQRRASAGGVIHQPVWGRKVTGHREASYGA